VLLVAFTPAQIPPVASELHYLSAQHPTEPQPLPSLQDEPSIALSVIVPAYNEYERLPIMIDEAMEYLVGPTGSKRGGAEIIVVDDGSSDRTSVKALELAQAWQSKAKGRVEVRVVTLARNRGKGGAVQHVCL